MENEKEKEVDFFPQQLWVKICVSILEETLDQLNILRKISNMPETAPVFETYRTVEERFSQFLVLTTQEEDMTREQKNVLTFEKNLAITEGALNATFEELKRSGSFEKLLDVIRIYKNLKTDEENLRKDARQKRDELKKLQFSKYKEKMQYHKKFAEVMMNIGKIKDKIRNFILEGEAKTRYIKNWQNGKLEELQISLVRKEEDLDNTLRRTDTDIFREMRIHEEILLAIDDMIKELEKQIELWKEKYDTSITEIDKKIEDFKKKKDKQREKIHELQAIYSKRQGHIDDYKQYKIEQERKKEELKRKNEAATHIQAWWRGVMVRMGFGRFRKKKDKKAKKGSSEKKEK